MRHDKGHAFGWHRGAQTSRFEPIMTIYEEVASEDYAVRCNIQVEES